MFASRRAGFAGRLVPRARDSAGTAGPTRPGHYVQTFFAPAKRADGVTGAFHVGKGGKVRAFFDHFVATVSDRLIAPASRRYLPRPRGV